MRLFLDTSAFAKRYVAEQGSDKVMALCTQADSLHISVICIPEFISSLTRLVREKKLGTADYQRLKATALEDITNADICPITEKVLDSSIKLLETNSLRAMDALHLACAVNTQPDFFGSADQRQLDAARNAGLVVVNVA